MTPRLHPRWHGNYKRQLLLMALLLSLFTPADNNAAAQTNAASPAATNPLSRRGPFDETADAHKDLANALAAAKTDGKLVLLDFGANWCPDCIALSRLFDDPTVKPFFAANFHLVKINVGRKDKNQDLCAQYDAPVSKGIPAVVVLSPDGQVLAATRGGEWANARSAKAEAILDQLKRWRTLQPPK